MASVREDDPAADKVLSTERDHLATSRDFLRLMREDVLSLPALAGDPVSEEYLKADLYHRAESLKDLPDTPLFFGRLDYEPGRSESVTGPGGTKELTAPGGESFHIGRRHVHDREGHPVVIDWRAPVSRPFYRASPGDPMGLTMRRRFGFSGGELTAFEDEIFAAAPSPQPGGQAVQGQAGPGQAVPGQTVSDQTGPGQTGPGQIPLSRIMIEEIERPRSGSMRDIVATIQPEQDDIVRADATESVCVQGAPGTGKTAVGLHRVAYLLYAFRERMSRGGVLVLGPNRAFLAYIRNVLPALGEFDAAQTSVTELISSVPIRGTDTERSARLKGDARMAEVLHRALWDRIGEPAESILVVRGSRRWRVYADRISELVGELRERGVRYGTGREMLSHRIAHVILSQMEAAGEICDDRTHEAVRRTASVKSAVTAIWPKADPVRVVFTLLSDRELLAKAADGLFTEAEQEEIAWRKPPRGPGSARWSAADAVLIDEVKDLMERTPSLAHVVVDEAQDLSAMACRAIGRRCTTGSVTVLGDIAQGTTAWATPNWEQMLGHLGKSEATLEILTTGYRVPRQILDFASQLLAEIAPELAPAMSIRQDPGSLEIKQVPAGGLSAGLSDACAEALTRPGSVAVIAADAQAPDIAAALDQAGLPHALLDGEAGDSQLVIVPVTIAKGLEFDHVIVVEPATIADAEARGLQRLYVALTRAVSRLTVLHTRPLP
ncbi:MAG: AAA family ATPase, partial [Nocardiopsaceae bacterium]|nr:AAA family ATPase [Nocardiopsaceae bacterium]